ncbi:MAG: hypothetical protein C0392_09685 [Syntrophus sp. (in: bacteria)]|nr:hypothetical protein [Syntrophus sp. (in: bacteria)]
MGIIKNKLHQWITDSKAVWQSTGGNRPFTERRMSEEEILNEHDNFSGNKHKDKNSKRSEGTPPEDIHHSE